MALNGKALAAELHSLYAKGDLARAIAAAQANASDVKADADASLFAGLAFAGSGAFDEAAAHLEDAARLRPNDPAIMGALARVMLLLKRDDEAEALMRALAAAAQKDPMAALHLTDTYFQAGRSEDAYHLLSAARRAFDHPMIDARLAEAAIRTGRVEEGVAASRRAEQRMGLAPSVVKIAGPAALISGDEAWFLRVAAPVASLPAAQAATIYDFWTNVLIACSFPAVASRTAIMATAAAPTVARLCTDADLRLAARDVPGAEAAASAALALSPGDANALTFLARCRMIKGAVDEAKDLLLRAIAADRDAAVAYDYLTQIDAGAMSAAMAAHLEAQLAADRIPGEGRTKALLALARRDEHIGEHQRAFGRIIEAKSIAAATARAGGYGYKPEETDRRLAQLKAMFAAPISLDRKRPAPKIIFVVGMPRSGTTLVEQILASHPNVYGGGERPELVDTTNLLLGSANDAAAAKSLIMNNADQWIAKYVDTLAPEAAEKGVVTDKHPLNFWSIGLIRALFPDARIVNLVRPPVDVCLSILRVRFFSAYAFANEIDAVTHYYAAYDSIIQFWRSIFGEAIYDIDYKSLVADPEGETRALLSYCGLAWDETCLNFHTSKREVVTHSAAQVREPINDRAILRSKQYGDIAKPLEDALRRYGVQIR